MLTVLDDHSRLSAVALLRKKSHATEVLITHIGQWESILRRTVRAIRSDNGTEFVNSAFNSFSDDNGIIRNFSVPYRSQQNGRVERLNGVLLDRTVVLLTGCDLGPVYWPEAIQYANYLRNRSPFTGAHTPYESFFGRRPNVPDIKVFGCVVWVKVDSRLRRKLDPKARKGRFIGFQEGVKGFRVLFPDGSIVVSRDCIFEELTTSDAESRQPTGERTTRGGGSDAEAIEEFVRLLAGGLDAGNSEQMPSDDTLDPAVDLKASTKHCLAIPSSYKQAVSSPSADLWLQATQSEYDSLLSNNVRELCELPSGRHALPVLWVYDLKRDATGHDVRQCVYIASYNPC